ncbi:MAG TPA: cell division protein FtsH, partial [Mesotoga sp.]|nr:cell division protein FtsH [Mesotoga sp.]
MEQRPRLGMILFYVVLGIFLLVALRGLYPSETSVEVPYTKFLDDFNNIIDIVIYDNGKVVYVTGDNPRRSLETYFPSQT